MKETNTLEMFKEICDIGLSHMETDVDENYDGEWEHTEYEEYDGTVEDNYPDSCEHIRDELTAFSIIKNKRIHIFEFMKDCVDYGDDYHQYSLFYRKYSIEKLTEDEFNTLVKTLKEEGESQL